MIVRYASMENLESALLVVNEKYAGNIVWNRAPEPLNHSGLAWRLTLRCISSRGAGRRISRAGVPFGRTPRRLISACWHVHGTFFDALPLGAEIVALGRAIRPHNAWQDYNIGSIMYPALASEACDCADAPPVA